MNANELRASHESSLCGALEILVERLDAACAGPTDALQAEVLTALAQAIKDPDLLSEGQRAARPDGYTRHVLHTDPRGRFTVVSLVWSAGQFSPVHGHHTWCGYGVVAGSLREEMYTWAPSRKVATVASIRDRNAGALSFAYAGLEEVHRLGNSGPERAVSVHVYGVDGPRVGSHVNRLVTPV